MEKHGIAELYSFEKSHPSRLKGIQRRKP